MGQNKCLGEWYDNERHWPLIMVDRWTRTLTKKEFVECGGDGV